MGFLSVVQEYIVAKYGDEFDLEDFDFDQAAAVVKEVLDEEFLNQRSNLRLTSAGVAMAKADARYHSNY